MVDKYELIRTTADNIGIPKITCEAIIDEFFSEIRRNLVQGNDINIGNFLTFRVKEYPPRRGYNILTGQVDTFPATKVVKCKLSPSIKNAVKARG